MSSQNSNSSNSENTLFSENNISDSSSSSSSQDIGSFDSFDTEGKLKKYLNGRTIRELNNMLQTENIVTHNSDCIRKNSNSGTMSKDYLFESIHFKPKKLLNNVKDFSPKLYALLEKIKSLDESDMKKHGRKFKHFIFSDVKSINHGVKLISSGLIASGLQLVYNADFVDPKIKEKAQLDDNSYNYNSDLSLKEPVEDNDNNSENSNLSNIEQPDISSDSSGENSIKSENKNKKIYKKIEILSEEKLKQNKGDNFILLSSTTVYQQPLSVAMKKSLFSMFNSRPDNVYGDNARIIVMDGGFKEGVDLFDIKYVHIFEPQTSMADQKQVIGRGTRTCGQKGLVFHPTKGWPLYVFNYDIVFDEKLGEYFMNSKNAIEYYLKSMNIDFRLYAFIEDFEKTCIKGSVDYELNKSIHNFAIDNDDEILGGGPKKKVLKIVDSLPEIPQLQIAVQTPEKFTHESMKKYINDNFSDYAWKDVKMENLCGYDGPEDMKKGGGTIMKYTPTQAFVSHYFTPQLPLKGMLLWHSVGTGKTCTAIATASSLFESMGYTILWVTRTTLKNDIWKNMFDQICNESIKNKQLSGVEIPSKQSERMRLLSKSWSIRPMSYKQFSNLVSKKNKFYKDLVKKNGEVDPLRKTLLIIDEAHKLYGGGDLSSIEKPNMEALYSSLMHSYITSGEDSVKLLLMTATPITQSPMELIKLINLFKMPQEQMPIEFGEFSDKFLNEEGNFTRSGEDLFLDNIAGHISYLNREKDARQFSQPIIKNVNVPIINNKMKKLSDAFDNKDELIVERQIIDTVNELDNKEKNIDFELKSFSRNKLGHLLDKCDELEYPSKIKTCKKEVRGVIKRILGTVKNEIDTKKKEIMNIKKTITAIKKINPDVRKRVNNMKNANDPIFKKTYKNTPYFKLKKMCRKSVKTNKEIDNLVNQQENIIKNREHYEEKLNQFNKLKLRTKNELKGIMTNIRQLNSTKTKNKGKLSEEELKLIENGINNYKKLANEYKIKTKLEIKNATKEYKEKYQELKYSKTHTRNKIESRIKKTKKLLTKKIKSQEKDLMKIEKSIKYTKDEPYEFVNELLKDTVSNEENNLNKLIENWKREPSKEELKLLEKQRKKEEKDHAMMEKKAEKERQKEAKATQKLREKEEKLAEKQRQKELKATQKLREKEEKKAQKEAEKERKKAEKQAGKERKKSEKNKK